MASRLEKARTACLMHGMMRTLGTTSEQVEGQLGTEALNAMMKTCRTFTRTTDCITWLLDHHEAGARRAPGYCLNGTQLDVLAS